MLDLINMNTEDKKKFIVHILSIGFYKLKEKINNINIEEFSLETGGDDITVRIVENGEPIFIKIEHPKIKKINTEEIQKRISNECRKV